MGFEGFSGDIKRLQERIDGLVGTIIQQIVQATIVLPIGTGPAFGKGWHTTGVTTQQPAGTDGRKHQKKLPEGIHHRLDVSSGPAGFSVAPVLSRNCPAAGANAAGTPAP